MASYEERFEKGEKRKRARNWEVDEIILLVQAKRNEWDKYERKNIRDRFESASDKWKEIVKVLQVREQGLTGKVKRNNNSTSIAIVMSEMNTSIQSSMAEAETNQNLRYEHLIELEREKMTVEREDRNKLMATEQEDRNKLISVLGSLAKSFEKISEKM
eukprot:Gb_21212 [translate_table: standard]